MRVTISVYAKFHAFRIASELQKRGLLAHLYTAYPKKVDDINNKLVSKLFPLVFLAGHFSHKISSYNLHYNCCRLFDNWVSNKLGIRSKNGADIFHGWSGFSLNSIKIAKRSGCATFIERSGSHIYEQIKLLEEEADILGIPRKVLLKHPYFELSDIMLEEYKLSDYIVVPSKISKRSFLKYGFPEERIIVLPLGTNFLLENINRTYRDPFRLIFVGSTDIYRKGIIYLIKAWQELRLKNAELTIVAPLTRHISSIIKENNIKIFRNIPPLRLREEYRKATAFCLPSIEEGFGMVVLEAMSFGLPVIITENVGAADLIVDGREGFIIPIRDTESLKERILFLYENREVVAEMGNQSLALSKRFTWDAYTNQLLIHYQNAIKQGNSF